MRDTSNSSATSRVIRSVSASMVSSMRRFWSSENRSQRRSSVDVKPLTLVSGDRSSCATVEMSAEVFCSARRRALASRSVMITCCTGPRGTWRTSDAVRKTS